MLLLGRDALAEHVVGPALVGKHDRDGRSGDDDITVNVYCEDDAL